MPIRAARLALTFLAILGLAGPALAAEDGPYPVWWSDKLELGSLEQVHALFRREFWPDIDGEFDLRRDGESDPGQVYVRICESLSNMSEAQYSAQLNINHKWQLFHLALCRAIAMLGRAKPARVSHLRDFVLNAGALDYLPPLVNLYPSCEFICYAVEANERGIPFTKFETPLVVDVESVDEMTVWMTSWRVILTIAGRGDFTGDGVDDMLLLANGHATEGTLGAADLIVVTRDMPGAVLRVIGAERELCPEYSCHPLPQDIKSYRDSSPPPAPADIGGSAGPSQPGSTATEDTAPYSVWWSYGFSLENLDQIDSWMQRNFWTDMSLSIRLYKGSYDNNTEAEARNCVELEALTQAGYGWPGGGLHYFQLRRLLRCRAVALLGTAQPARESFLRDFVISQESSRDLLRALGLVVGGGVPSQSGEMVLTRGLGKFLVVDLPYSGDADIWADKGRVLLRVEARGDFTGDGIEDLLFSAGTTRSRYRPKISDLCLITREAADSPLRLIEVEPYSCREPGKYGRPTDENNPG